MILKLDSDVISSTGALDGEWSNGVSSFPSGNGTVGGDFNFRLNYLTGDTTGDRAVLARDFADVKKKFFQDTTSPVTGADTDYSPFYDLDGSGFILAIDFAEVKKLFDELPGPEPTAVLAAPGEARPRAGLTGPRNWQACEMRANALFGSIERIAATT